MMSVGMVIAYYGYAIIYWGVNAIQDKSQGSFVSYIFPFL